MTTRTITDLRNRTDAEWERTNLDAACQHLDDAHTAVLRAMYRDTHDVPGTYQLAIRCIRQVRDDLRTMADARKDDA